jgi:hypothetical protein
MAIARIGGWWLFHDKAVTCAITEDNSVLEKLRHWPSISHSLFSLLVWLWYIWYISEVIDSDAIPKNSTFVFRQHQN